MSSKHILVQGPELVFGAFRFLPQQRLLYRGNTPVRIGSRAREILVTLLENAGQIVKKNDLVARVWAHTVVEEGTLRVHIAGLRKALKDGKDGARFVENVTGLGYRFVAPIAHAPGPRQPDTDDISSTGRIHELEKLREENAQLRRVMANLTLELAKLDDGVAAAAVASHRTATPATIQVGRSWPHRAA